MGKLVYMRVRHGFSKLIAVFSISFGATLLIAPGIFAQTAEERVLQAISEFAEDFNNADRAAVREHLYFPAIFEGFLDEAL